eukprot:scpid16921/ scgid7259/ Testis, prostate and placenta-expressed protein
MSNFGGRRMSDSVDYEGDQSEQYEESPRDSSYLAGREPDYDGVDEDEDDEQVGSMSVVVCGQPFEHRAQSARRRTKSAQLRQTGDTVKLAGVKSQIYNPALPSLRRMDMDDTGHRLTYEHSRATSALTRRSFNDCRTTFFQPATSFPSKRITETSRPLEDRLRVLSASAPTRPIPWTSLMQSLSTRRDEAADRTPTPVRNVGVFGFTTRHLHPSQTQSWKLNLRGGTGVDQKTYSQHLVPSDINFRYRNRSPQYMQRASTAAWH